MSKSDQNGQRNFTQNRRIAPAATQPQPPRNENDASSMRQQHAEQIRARLDLLNPAERIKLEQKVNSKYTEQTTQPPYTSNQNAVTWKLKNETKAKDAIRDGILTFGGRANNGQRTPY